MKSEELEGEGRLKTIHSSIVQFGVTLNPEIKLHSWAPSSHGMTNRFGCLKWFFAFPCLNNMEVLRFSMSPQTIHFLSSPAKTKAHIRQVRRRAP
jgi:hypothetical protein